MSSRLIVSAFCVIAVLTANLAGAEPPKPKDGPLAELPKPKGGPPKPKDGPHGMKFVPLPKGTFYMGWYGEKGSAKKTEIKEDFEIAIHTVTQGQVEGSGGEEPKPLLPRWRGQGQGQRHL